jgi:hypothetical protein
VFPSKVGAPAVAEPCTACRATNGPSRRESHASFLYKTPSLEARQRIEALVERLGPGQSLPGPLLQRVRAVEVLGCIGSPDARTVLQSIAQGAPGARLTQQARLTLALLQSE